ncbi:hypothetical protein JIK52_29190 (plasmid) [Klebsiella variicola]|nr:hypothetical protein [Klebsiella variicola]QQM89029.1 hypothetical protein JIK52_29190 [Klebsiella variicola]
MEHVKRQIQQGAGNAYYAGMQWRGITLGHADAAALNQFDIDISKAQAPKHALVASEQSGIHRSYAGY